MCDLVVSTSVFRCSWSQKYETVSSVEKQIELADLMADGSTIRTVHEREIAKTRRNTARSAAVERLHRRVLKSCHMKTAIVQEVLTGSCLGHMRRITFERQNHILVICHISERSCHQYRLP